MLPKLMEEQIRFKIPKTTPPGFYLLRIEAFAPADYAEGSQWYVNCAQVEIRGPGGGMCSPSIQNIHLV